MISVNNLCTLFWGCASLKSTWTVIFWKNKNETVWFWFNQIYFFTKYFLVDECCMSIAIRNMKFFAMIVIQFDGLGCHVQHLRQVLLVGCRTFQPRNFQPRNIQPQALTPDFSIPDSWLKSPGLKSLWLKSLELKSPGLISWRLKSLGLKRLG